MNVLVTTLLMLYIVALHVSMAGMEIVGWTIITAILIYQIRHRDFSIMLANKNVLIWQGVMTLAILGSLLATPLEKPFMFQFGFMRWIFVLWGLTFALNLVWSAKFEAILLRVWIAMLLIDGAYGVLQCLTGIDFFRDMAVYLQGDGVYKAVGFFSLSMTYAYSIGISLMALSIPALQSRFKGWGALACIFGVLGVISSMSRGAWAAVAICAFIYLGVNLRRYVVPVAIGLVLAVVGLALFSRGFANKIYGLAELNVDHSSNVRLDLWRGYWQMFIEHPLFGVGIFEGDKLLPGIFKQLGIVQLFVSHAHNNFLQFLGGAGIFGLASYVALSWIFLRKAWTLRTKSFAWGWSVFLAQIFLQLGGLTEANFINAVVNHILMLTWAIVLVLEARPREMV